MTDSTVFSDTFFIFGAHCEVVFPGRSAEESKLLLQLIKTNLEELESKISRKNLFSFVRDTDQMPAGEWMKAPDDFFDLLNLCGDFYQMSNGAFDVTLGPLNEIWAREDVDEADIAEASSRCGFNHLEIDAENRRFRFLKDEMKLDFGTIEKAWALDLLKAILKEQNVESCIVSFEEENLLAMGQHPSAKNWPIGVRNFRDPNDFLHVFELKDQACCAAGTVFLRDDGQGMQNRIVISPENGKPVEGKRSVVVRSESATFAAFLAHCWIVLPENDRSIIADQLKNIEIFESEYLDGDILTRQSIINGTNDGG